MSALWMSHRTKKDKSPNSYNKQRRRLRSKVSREGKGRRGKRWNNWVLSRCLELRKTPHSWVSRMLPNCISNSSIRLSPWNQDPPLSEITHKQMKGANQEEGRQISKERVSSRRDTRLREWRSSSWLTITRNCSLQPERLRKWDSLSLRSKTTWFRRLRTQAKARYPNPGTEKWAHRPLHTSGAEFSTLGLRSIEYSMWEEVLWSSKNQRESRIPSRVSSCWIPISRAEMHTSSQRGLLLREELLLRMGTGLQPWLHYLRNSERQWYLAGSTQDQESSKRRRTTTNSSISQRSLTSSAAAAVQANPWNK